MSMYVELLTRALAEWPSEIRDDTLVEYARNCRREMVRTSSRRQKGAYAALAAEIAYDRALVKLCLANDVVVAPDDFSHPEKERRELEVRLAERGLDLVGAA